MDKVLLVDDDRSLLRNLIEAAKKEGREIYTASSLEEAIESIEKNDFNVVVTDLFLIKNSIDPTGINVIEAAKKKNVLTQVIAVTYRGDAELCVKTIKLGAFDYIERGAPNTDNQAIMEHQIDQALEFGKLKRGAK